MNFTYVDNVVKLKTCLENILLSAPSEDGSEGTSSDQIGSDIALQQRRMASIRRTMVERGGSENDLDTLTAKELVIYNPLLKKHTPTTRLAYAKFKSFNLKSSNSNLNSKFKDIAETWKTKSTIKEESETTTATSTIKSGKKTVSRSSSLLDSISSLHGCLTNEKEDYCSAFQSSETLQLTEKKRTNNMVEKQGFDLKVTCEIDTAQNIFEPFSVSDQEFQDKFSPQDNPDFEKESSVTNSQWAIFTIFF